jgi:hypothetical protein
VFGPVLKPAGVEAVVGDAPFGTWAEADNTSPRRAELPASFVIIFIFIFYIVETSFSSQFIGSVSKPALLQFMQAINVPTIWIQILKWQHVDWQRFTNTPDLAVIFQNRKRFRHVFRGLATYLIDGKALKSNSVKVFKLPTLFSVWWCVRVMKGED